jgi:hypothetical protein
MDAFDNWYANMGRSHRLDAIVQRVVAYARAS